MDILYYDTSNENHQRELNEFKKKHKELMRIIYPNDWSISDYEDSIAELNDFLSERTMVLAIIENGEISFLKDINEKTDYPYLFCARTIDSEEYGRLIQKVNEFLNQNEQLNIVIKKVSDKNSLDDFINQYKYKLDCVYGEFIESSYEDNYYFKSKDLLHEYNKCIQFIEKETNILAIYDNKQLVAITSKDKCDYLLFTNNYFNYNYYDKLLKIIKDY